MSNCHLVALSPEEATREIRRIVRYGSILTSKHCRLDSMPKRNVSFQDLISVLQNGKVIEDPIYDKDHESYKYKVEGTTIDDDSVVAISVLVNHRSVLVVTVF